MQIKLYLQDWTFLCASFLRYFFPYNVDKFSYFLILLAMWILKHSYEGYHLGNLLLLIAVLIVLSFDSGCIQIIAIAIQFLGIIISPIYYPLEQSGKFNVGFKSLQLKFPGEEFSRSLSIFYPCQEPQNCDLLDIELVSPSVPIMERIYQKNKLEVLLSDNINIIKKIKSQHWWSELKYNTLKRSFQQSVNNKGTLINNESLPFPKKKFPLILFSHDYGKTQNLYISLLQHWASIGFIVVASDHLSDDQLFLNKELQSKLKENLSKKEKKQFLQIIATKQNQEKRVVELKSTLNFIFNTFELPQQQSPETEQAVELLFLEKSLQINGKQLIDFDQIYLVGHGLGASTCLKLKETLPEKITGGFIFLNPFLISENLAELNNIKQKFIIRSSSQNNNIYDNFKINKDNESQEMTCEYTNINNFDFSDLDIMFWSKNIKQNVDIMINTARLTELFLLGSVNNEEQVLTRIQEQNRIFQCEILDQKSHAHAD